MSNQFDGLLDKLIAKSNFRYETPEEWEKRHEGHTTEPLTPEKPFETCSLVCYDCDEYAEWKGNVKINRGD